jgi:hypothetical protein
MRPGIMLAALVISLGVAGCADNFDHDVDGLVGKPVSYAVARLGQPQVSRAQSNGPTYSWLSNSKAPTDLSKPPSASRCRIEAKTDTRGVIYATRYSGNDENCARFAKALHRR